MSCKSIRGDDTRLGDFLDALAEARSKGEEYFCAIPASVRDRQMVSQYVWANRGESVCSADGCTLERGRIFVASRNYSLHRLSLSFRVESDSATVTMKGSPGSAPASSFTGKLTIDRKPPSRTLGVETCKACEFEVGQTFDPTITFVCFFSTSHDGKPLSDVTRNMVLRVDRTAV